MLWVQRQHVVIGLCISRTAKGNWAEYLIWRPNRITGVECNVMEYTGKM